MDFSQIAYEVEDGVLTITLDRPDKLNAFTTRMQHELVAAFDEADADDDVRAVVVTGRGRAFCAGADLSAGADSFDAGAQGAAGGFDPERHRDGGGQVSLRIFELTKPVIAAINGPAVGVGITMCLPMDVRFCAEDAKLGFVFAQRGIVPEAASSWFLPRVVGISQAMEWVATGRVFSAAEALEGGLVRSLHPADEVLTHARALAREVVEHTSGVSVAFARQMMWRMLGADHPMAAHEADSRAIHALGSAPDVREGVTSFLEKRPARFPMRPSTDMPPEAWPFWEERTFT